MKALVIFGSLTNEDKYGRASGERVVASLTRKGFLVEALHASDRKSFLCALSNTPPDLVVPVGFGPPCEDGHIFAVARLAGIPCAGPSPAAGSLMQDKSNLARVAAAVFGSGTGIHVPQGVSISGPLAFDEFTSVVRSVKPPYIVKPCFSGSSEGLGVFDDLYLAYESTMNLVAIEGEVLIQHLEHPTLCEISCTMVEDLSGSRLLPIVELTKGDARVLDAKLKFGQDAKSQHVIPARLPLAVEMKIKWALPILHKAVGAVGLTRTDIIVRPDGDLVILEMNGIPGLLETSIASDAAKAAGIEFDDLAEMYAMSAFLPRREPKVW